MSWTIIPEVGENLERDSLSKSLNRAISLIKSGQFVIIRNNETRQAIGVASEKDEIELHHLMHPIGTFHDRDKRANTVLKTAAMIIHNTYNIRPIVVPP